MGESVPLKMFLPAERLVALRTGEGLLAGVNLGVDLQMVGRTVTLVAQRTTKIALLGVDLGVL